MSTYNRVVAADETASLAPTVRARLATEMADPATEVGASLSGTFATVAKNLLARMENNAAIPTTMASPPSIDHSAAPAGTRTLYSAYGFGTEGHVSLLGPTSGWSSSARSRSASSTLSGIDLIADTSVLHLSVISESDNGISMWVWVDGQPTTAAPENIAASVGASVVTNITFAARQRHRITVYVGGINAWAYVTVDALGSSEAAPEMPRVALDGDSFYAGSASSSATTAGAAIIARALGVNPIVLAAGGTGYAAGATQIGDAARTAAAAAFGAQAIIISGAVNDSATGLATAATTAYANYATALPGVPVIVFGPQPTNATDTVSATRAQIIAAVKSSAEAAPNVIAFYDQVGTGATATAPAAFATYTTYTYGDLVSYRGAVFEWRAATGGNSGPYIPTESTSWSLKTWAYVGTGYANATTGNGSRDIYLGVSGSTDQVHPSKAGQEAFSAIQVNRIRQALAVA